MSNSILMRDIIRERRVELGLSQVELGRSLGVASGEFICMVEAGRRHFAVNNIPRLATALGLGAADLCRCALFELAPALYQATFGETEPERPKPITNL